MGWKDAPIVEDEQIGQQQRATPAWMSAPEISATAGVSPSKGSMIAENIIGDPLSSRNADIYTGAEFGARAGASIKMTPEGKINYLKNKYGPENVAVRSDGEIFYRKPGSESQNLPSWAQKGWIQFDESAASLSDIADLTGGTLEAAPAIATGFFTANPLAVGGAAAGGNILRQAVSESLPGSDEMSLEERAIRPLTSAAIAGGLQAGINVLSPIVSRATPHNIIATRAQQALQSPAARRGAQLAESTGIRFTPGQESGNRTMLMLEGAARRNPITAERIASEVDRPQIQQALSYLNRTINRIDPRGLGPIQTGQHVHNAYTGTINRLVNARRAQATTDMQHVTRLAGRQPVFALNNAVREIDDMVATLHTPVGSDTANRTLESLMRLRERITGTPAGSAQVERGMAPYGEPTGREALVLTPEQFQRTLHIWGNAARGTGNILEDLGDAATNRMINTRLFRALQQDLDDAADNPGAAGEVAGALRTFRDNYRAGSQAIDDVGESVLGRIFGGNVERAPEAVADSFMKMHPSEIQAAMHIINQQAPETAQAVKRTMIEQALEAGRPSGSAAQNAVTPILGGSGTRMAGNELSPAKFNSFLQKNAARYRAALNPREYVDMKRAYEALGRLADRGGTEGSPTQPLQKISEFAKALYGIQPTAIASVTGQGIAMRRIANIMATDEGRRALITLSRASPNTIAFRNASANLGAIIYRDDVAMRANAQQLSQETPQSSQDQIQQ